MQSWLEQVLQEQYSFVKCLKRSEAAELTVLEHNQLHKKILKRSFTGNPEVYQKLLTLHHHNMPEILEVVHTGERVTVLEEYIDGVTLFDLLHENLCTEKAAKALVSSLCDVLTLLHTHHIVHRDIKPQNTMIDKAQTVKLIDFDSARLYKPFYPQDTEYLGTPGYAAPEQYGDTQTDGRTDIFSLGILMNEMLTGKKPTEQLYSGKLGRVIEKCIQVSPEKRFQDAAQLKRSL